jgi:hypothetical protein
VNKWLHFLLIFSKAREREPLKDVETKLKAVRRGAGYSFPSGDIGQMLGEIERGYRLDL